jgi:hypothetical protein
MAYGAPICLDDKSGGVSRRMLVTAETPCRDAQPASGWLTATMPDCRTMFVQS